MSMPKKRKSDVHIDHCAQDKSDSKRFQQEENYGENRRKSIFSGMINKIKSSTSLKQSNKSRSSSNFEHCPDETQLSINSESSVASAESGPSSLVSNIAKNAMLRSFVNRDSFTPTLPPDPQTETLDHLNIPAAGISKQESLSKMEDSISVSSQMSIDTIGSSHNIDEDSTSIGSASAFCTPSRNPINRNGLRMSTRSVPDRDKEDLPPALFRSLCNSAVRRVQNPKLDLLTTPMRRSMRMSIQKRNVNGKNMADVPEEEEAVVLSNSSLRVSEPILEEDDERFGAAKEFFDNNVTSHEESADEGTASISRLSTASESRVSNGGLSIGRKNSFLRKMFHGKNELKERRMSDVFHGMEPSTSTDRRSSMASFTNDCSFTGAINAASNTNLSVTSNDSMKKPKMRKKTPSTSNLTQRLSSVFRRSSSSAVKDDDVFGLSAHSSRRNTLTGFSSISSGIGSIASGVSDQGYGTIGSRNGQSISRTGSKRDDENKRERTRRLLDRIIISDITAGELLRMKAEQMKLRVQKELVETFETQLNENVTSPENEHLNFDVVAIDVKADGTPFSTTAGAFIDDKVGKMVKEEIRTNFRPDRCGSLTESDPEIVFVIPEQPQSNLKGLNDSIASNDVTSDLLRNVRGGLCKAIEEWKKITSDRNSSTMLIYPMFCPSEDEWDSKATIDALFLMLDGILMNAKRWRPNGKCILAGITASNVQLLREKYEDLKQSVATTESDGPLSNHDDLDAQSVTSTSTMFGTNM